MDKDETPFGDDIADEASSVLSGKGHVDHLHSQWHDIEKKRYDIAEKHGWTPEALNLQKPFVKKAEFINGALSAAINGPVYTDGTGCNLCGNRDPRAYEGPARNTTCDLETDVKFNEIVEGEKKDG